MDFKLIVDTGGDYSDEFLSKNDIERLPIVVSDGERDYAPGVDISRDILFQEMRRGKVYQTSQISSSMLKEVFENYAKQKKNVIYYALSAGLTAGVEAARLVEAEVKKNYPDFGVLVWDSKLASAGTELLLSEFLKRTDELNSWEEVKKFFLYLRESIRVFFSVGDMQFLFRGGRMSKASYLIGTALSIKPLLFIDDNGKLAVKEKIRGEKMLYQKFAKSVLSEWDKEIPIYVAQGDNDKMANSFMEELDRQLGKKGLYVKSFLGETIGAHTGPEVLVVSFFTENVRNYKINS